MGSCFSFIPQRRKWSSEREPLLPTHHHHAIPKQRHPQPEPLLYKFADIIGALQQGKLPSQDQLNIILQTVLKSELLRDDAHMSGYGPLSRSGKRVLDDVREVIKAILQIGIEKNADDKFQDLLYQCSKIYCPPVHIEADDTIDAGHKGLSELHAQANPAPTSSELASDTFTFVTYLPSLIRLILTSAFFRLLLSDLCRLLVDLAADIATVSAEVQVAAEDVKRTVDADEGWFNVLRDKVNETTQAVEDVDLTAKARKTAKGMFIARVQELIVRAHQDPETLLALRTIHSIINKYAQKLSCSADIISNGNATADSHSPTSRGPETTVKPTPETSRALHNLKLLLERFASGYSLDTFLRFLAGTVQNIIEPSSNPMDRDIHIFLHELDVFVRRALAPSHRLPRQKCELYVTSRLGKHMLEELYERGSTIFLTDYTTSTDLHAKPKWRTSFQELLHEYDAYVSALHSDCSTAKLIGSVDKLYGSVSDFLGLGTSVAGAKRKTQFKEEIAKDLVGWAIPHMGKLLLRLVPIPRLEFRSGKVEGALEFGSAGAGVVEVESELVPDSVVLRSWNEIRVDTVPASGEMHDESRGVRASSSNRIHIHVKGVRFSAHDVGYFVRYNRKWPWAGYVDQGLISIDVGHASTGGLGIDIELECNSHLESDSHPERIVEDDHGDQQSLSFRIAAVKFSLSGLTFTLSKSKHYILNKLFVQPLAGPLVSKIVTGMLEEQVSKALTGFTETWKEVMREVKNKRERMNDDDWMDYVDAVAKKAAKSLRKEDDELETHTRVTMKGMVHTRANVARDQDTPARHEHVQEEETVVAVGAGEQLFPDKVGAYGEDEARSSSEAVAGNVIDGAQAVVIETLEAAGGVTEFRKEVENVQWKRKKRVRFEGIHADDRGWGSAAFDL